MAAVPVLPVSFEGKRVLVTGASRGIGRVLARGFATAGATTIFAARHAEPLEVLAEEIEQAGEVGRPIVADLAAPEGVEELLAAVLGDYGGVDVLVNNAGIAGPISPVEDTAVDGWEETLAVNLTGPFLVTRGLVPSMKRQGAGAILNIGSINGKSPFANRSSYAASKMGLIGLTRTLAQELGPSGIRANCILPANVEGERVEEILESSSRARGISVDEARREILALSPLRSQVAPESILNLALFLASDHAQHMTGQDINVTAGILMQ